MKVKEAIEILGLIKPIKENELKKSYYKKCLQYHPDKNKNGTEMFKKVQEAYDIIKENINIINESKEVNFNSFLSKEDNIESLSYIELLNKYINTFSSKYNWDNDFIKNSIEKIILGAQDISLSIFDNLEPDKALEIYDFVSKYSNIFSVGTNILEKMKGKMKEKLVDEKKIILSPSITDLLNDKIYVLDINDEKENTKKIYIPLWHNELYYNNNYVVKIIPDLEENIYIDDNNDIHILISKNIKEIFNKEDIVFEIQGKYFNIDVNELKLKDYQLILIKEKGILRINEKDMFSNKERGNIIVHLSLYM